MNGLYLYDDAVARRFAPFSLTRPIASLRAGNAVIAERWKSATGLTPEGCLSAPALQSFEEGELRGFFGTAVPAGTVVANARCAVSLGALPPADAWSCGGRVCAVRLDRDVPAEQFLSGTLALETLVSENARLKPAAGWWLDQTWDLLRTLPEMLTADIRHVAPDTDRSSAQGVTTLGEHEVVIERGAHVEPLVVLDATAGPILVQRGATIAAFTRLVGPCVIGTGTQVGGGRIATCSIGDACRVHGEMSHSILVGHANKSHDGFLGHSLLGRWVNLGAGTTTSNLKNTYGSVQLQLEDGLVDTGLQFCGTFFGDHVKTAIGTRLTTGSIIGAGANVFTDGMTPKVVAPFAWGGGDSRRYDVAKFLDVAQRAMARRGVTLSESMRALLAAAHARTEP